MKSLTTVSVYFDQFPVDVYQWRRGQFVNMNTNEVLANIGLELMGQKGEYQYLEPERPRVNKMSTTNDAYPTGFPCSGLRLYRQNPIDAINQPREGFERKAVEFRDILKWAYPAAGRRTDDASVKTVRSASC